jgi:undecaprenyl-diphosphatase
MDVLYAIILGFLEGITEFLPISSTGHLILANQWIAFSPSFTPTFDIAIQSGAMCAVMVVFWRKIWPLAEGTVSNAVLKTWSKIGIAVLPAIVVGGTFGSQIRDALFSPIIVALALIVGGIALMFLEWRRHTEHLKTLAAIPYRTAFFIGLIQCLALIPGTSRSAATILGALFFGVSRPLAAEFSFLLAIPTLFAATAYSVLHDGVTMSTHELFLLSVGFVAAFTSAFVVVKTFLRYIQSQNFLPFAYYRVALGLVMLIVFFVA